MARRPPLGVGVGLFHVITGEADMPASEKQYDQDSKQEGFPSEGARLDHIEALHNEHAMLTARGDDRANEVADHLVKLGEDDPRKATRGRAKTSEE